MNNNKKKSFFRDPFRGIFNWLEDIACWGDLKWENKRKGLRYRLIPKPLEPRFLGTFILMVLVLAHLLFIQDYEWSLQAVILTLYFLIHRIIQLVKDVFLARNRKNIEKTFFFVRHFFDLFIIALLGYEMPESHSHIFILVLFPLFAVIKKYGPRIPNGMARFHVFFCYVVFTISPLYQIIDLEFDKRMISYLFFRTFAFSTICAFSMIISRRYNKIERYHETLMNSIADGVIAVRGRNAEIIAFNKASQEMLGYTEDEAKKVGIFAMYGAPVPDKEAGEIEARHIMEMMLENDGKITNYETKLWSSDGRIIPICLSTAFINAKLGGKYGSIGVYKDLRKVMLLQDISAQAHSYNSEEELSYDVMQRISDIISCEFVLICLFDGRSNTLEFNYCYPTNMDTFLNGKRIKQKDPFGLAFFESKVVKFKNDEFKFAEKSDVNDVLISMGQFSAHHKIGNLLTAPIKSDKEDIGVLGVLNKRKSETELVPEGFTSEDEKTLNLLIPQLYYIIKDVSYRKSKDTLFRTSEALANEYHRDKILLQFNKALRESIKYWVCYIRLLEGDELVIKSFSGQSDLDKFVDNPKYNMKIDLDCVSTRVFRNGRYEQHLDVSKLSDFHFKELIKSEKLMSMLSMPMIYNGQTIGVINCYTVQPHIFSLEEREVVQSFTELATAAIMRSEALSKSDVFVRITSTVYQADNLTRAVYLILTGITHGEGLGFNRAAVFLYNEDNSEVLEGKWGVGFITKEEARECYENMKETDIDLETLCSDEDRFDNWRYNEPFNRHVSHINISSDNNIIKELRKNGNFLKMSSPANPFVELWAGTEAPRDYALVWISIAGQRKGIIYLDNLYKGFIDDKKLQAVSLFGSLLATSRERFRVDEALNLAVRLAIHQTKGPISAIKQNVSVLLEHFTFDNPDMLKFIKNIETSSRKASFTIQKILNLAIIDKGRFHPLIVSIKISDFITSIKKEFSEEQSSRINHAMSEDGNFYSDFVLSSQCVMLILENALTHTEGPVTLKVEPFEKIVKFSIIDSGPGIPEEMLDTISRRYYSNYKNKGKQGMGIGLYLVDQLLRILNARYSVSNNKEQKGITVTITFFIKGGDNEQS